MSLIVLDGVNLEQASLRALQPLIDLDYIRQMSLDKVSQVKGMEFQHVFIFIKRGLYEELQIATGGLGRDVYTERRLFRIPFSRAKDSLVTFVLDAA